LTRHWLTCGCISVVAAFALARTAHAGQHDYDAMVAAQASANHVPAALVHRVIQRESRYHPELIGHGGTIGLMQIKLATAKGLGYTGDAEGLRDPNTNLIWGVKYLAGAYRAAEGDHDRAVHYCAAGYYYAAKRLRLAAGRRLEANGDPQPPLGGDAPRKHTSRDALVARARVPSAPLSILPRGAKAAQAR
jgi:soluble lytic murein transglycosylase-like protein